MAPPDLHGKRILVVGMARSGVAAARVAVRRGARVTCTDRRPDAPRVDGAEHVYGAHRREDFLGADLIVVSPGVPPAQPDLAAAVAAGVPVTGELAFAASLLEGALLLAVSGTNGKSTTTHLLGQLLTRAGLRTFTGGNLGVPLSEAVDGGFEALAVEVSSYQMELPGRFHPRAAAILNLTPDHLERHGTMDEYGRAKCRMFARMGPEDTSIVPGDDARLNRLAAVQPGRRLWLGAHPGVTVDGDRLRLVGVGPGPVEVSLAGFELPGRHNRENVAAAVLLAVCGGVAPERISVAGLTGLPHRMEVVSKARGLVWINDSKATNVESTLAAVDGFERPYVCLLGGRAKAGSAWSSLVGPLRSARAVVCFGEAGPIIADALAHDGLSAHRAGSLDEAVALAVTLARPGDALLLSPACASFDGFTDFEHRGRHFAALAEATP